MRAGRLDCRVTIQRPVIVRDSLNNPAPSWEDVATVWASREELRDSERIAALEVGSEIGVRFQVRYSQAVADTNAKDRLVCEGKTYEIVGVKEIGRRRGLEISAVARGD